MTFRSLFLVLCACATARAQLYNISALNFGHPMTGDNPRTVSLYRPAAIAFDATAAHYGAGLGATWIATDRQVFRIDYTLSIGLIIGGDLKGFAGDGGPATTALLDSPSGLIVTPAGDLLIADSGNQRIRKVDHVTGIITTWAGGGAGLGDGGPAAQASFSYPQGMAFDSQGNLYIADSQAHRIRKIDTAGTITTVTGAGSSHLSGTQADNFALTRPVAVVVDNFADYLYIADYADRQVYSLDLFPTHTHIVFNQMGHAAADRAVVAGNPRRTNIGQPYGLTIDGNYRLWVASTYGLYEGASYLGEFNKAAGVPETNTGSLGGLAIDGARQVHLTSANSILRFAPNALTSGPIATGAVTTVAGNGFGAFTDTQASPRALVYDTDGTLYFADTDSHIRKRDPATGAISTVAGTGVVDINGPDGPALNTTFRNVTKLHADGRGHLIVFDSGGYSIRRIDLASGLITTLKYLSIDVFRYVNNSSDFVLDRAGNIYYSETSVIWKLDAVTLAQTYVAGAGGPDDTGDGGPATSASLAYIGAMAMDAADNLYVVTNALPAEPSSARIRRIAASTGIITTVAGGGADNSDSIPAVQARIKPASLALDARGNLIFPDVAGNVSGATGLSYSIRRISPAGLISTVAGTQSFGSTGDGGPALPAALSATGELAIAPNGSVAFVSVTDPTEAEGLTEGLFGLRILTPLPVPFLTTSIQTKVDGSLAGQRVWTLNVSNTGVGAAMNPRITQAAIAVSAGPGPVSLVTPLPIAIGSTLAPGSSVSVPMVLNFPVTSPITRVSIAITLTDDSGQVNTVTLNNLFR